MAEPDAARTAPQRRGSLKRRLLFLALLIMGLEAAGWLDDYIFNHRQRLLSALVMMRLDTQPIPALSDTSNNRARSGRTVADRRGRDFRGGTMHRHTQRRSPRRGPG